MKKPTTSYAIAVSEMPNRIDEAYLLKRGFQIVKETPLLNTYQHQKNRLVFASIGMYGELTICEVHWCNGTPEREFSTVNTNIKCWEFDIILKYLNITL